MCGGGQGVGWEVGATKGVCMHICGVGPGVHTNSAASCLYHEQPRTGTTFLYHEQPPTCTMAPLVGSVAAALPPSPAPAPPPPPPPG